MEAVHLATVDMALRTTQDCPLLSLSLWPQCHQLVEVEVEATPGEMASTVLTASIGIYKAPNLNVYYHNNIHLIFDLKIKID